MGRGASERGSVHTTVTPERIALGSALRKMRVALGLSQQALADTLNTTQGYVAQWENGDREIPASMLIKVGALGIRAAEVFIEADLILRDMQRPSKR